MSPDGAAPIARDDTEPAASARGLGDPNLLRQFGELLLDLGPPLCLADAKGRIVHANDRFRSLADAADAPESTPWSPERLRRIGARAKARSTAIEIVESVSCDGKQRHLRGRFLWLSNGTAETSVLAALFEDATAEYIFRERSADMEGRLDDLTRLVSDWLWETDEKLNFTAVSPRIMDVLGRHPRQVIGRNLLSFGTFRLKPGGAKTCPDELADHGTFTGQVYEVPAHPEGTRMFRMNGIPVFDPVSDCFRGYRGTAHNITVETEAQANAAMSRAQLMEAIESFPAGFALFDDNDRLIICNREFRTVFLANDRKPAAGADVFEFMARCFAGGEIELLGGTYEDWAERRKTLSSAKGESYDMALKDGRWLRVSDLRTTDGGAVTIWNDITELKTREVALAEARDSAEIANQSKSTFLATVSHELRTPLNAIIGFSDMMRNETLGAIDNRQYVEYVNDIHRSGEHLLDIINDILDVSKAESGKLTLVEEPVDMADVIATALKLTRGLAQLDDIEITAPPGVEGLGSARLPTLRGDTRKLTQVLLNLISNAVKFTTEGGRIDVTARVDEAGDFVLEVRDTGIGIAEQDLAGVMIPFVQAQSDPYQKRDGTGLGLPLSRALIELHGGSLDIESALGQGTTVTVKLPKDRVVAAA